MDNATMIALVGYYKALKKEYTSWQNIKANPNWEIE
jgi:tRNA A37 threonylcarbamoyltransferase TsaD